MPNFHICLLVLGMLVACSSSGVDESSVPVATRTLTLPGSPLFEQSGAAPMIDFSGVQKVLGGEPTRVLVLGTAHLGGLPEQDFDPRNLSLLLDRLEGFSPDIIAIEAVGGRTCDLIQRYEALYPSAQQYCTNVDEALAALNMSRPEAAAALEQALLHWGDSPSPAERRRLALLFLGAGEYWSAVLQWSLLEESDRIRSDGVTKALMNRLNKALLSRNENRLIGVELAQRRGIDQLAAMDDHSADVIQTRAPENFSATVQAAWATIHPLADTVAAQRRKLDSPEQVIEEYLFINSEPFLRYSIEEDFGQATAMPDNNAVARQYVAWWQARGLRMAANVIEAAGNHPGARVLVIVGASHKPYFEAYLDQMHDIELISVEQVLCEDGRGCSGKK